MAPKIVERTEFQIKERPAPPAGIPQNQPKDRAILQLDHVGPGDVYHLRRGGARMGHIMRSLSPPSGEPEWIWELSVVSVTRRGHPRGRSTTLDAAHAEACRVFEMWCRSADLMILTKETTR